jgi:hypothetical protein
MCQPQIHWANIANSYVDIFCIPYGNMEGLQHISNEGNVAVKEENLTYYKTMETAEEQIKARHIPFWQLI